MKVGAESRTSFPLLFLKQGGGVNQEYFFQT
jgi:hypothetical protein